MKRFSFILVLLLTVALVTVIRGIKRNVTKWKMIENDYIC